MISHRVEENQLSDLIEVLAPFSHRRRASPSSSFLVKPPDE
jgi:hypothetical protein